MHYDSYCPPDPQIREHLTQIGIAYIVPFMDNPALSLVHHFGSEHGAGYFHNLLLVGDT